MSLRVRLSTYWCAFQEHLFPRIEQDLGPLGARYQCFISVLELVRVEQHLPCRRSLRGRPQQDRAALARAFIAKAVFQIDATRALRERLANDRALLTSASVHDSQVAIPLATMTAARVTNCYDLMDAAYDAAEIRAHSELLGHVPIIDVNPRNSAARKRGLQQEAKDAAHARPRGRQGGALPGAVDGGARQRSAEGRIRRPAGTRARAPQGALPLDVRHPGVDRGPVAALRELSRSVFAHVAPQAS